MRRILSLSSLLMILSCNLEEESPLLSPDNLSSWRLKVDANTDSVFQSPKGALIRIKKGTFEREVELEIKEAYTMRDILLAGLTTRSNGELLSSGGMIYVNAIDTSEKLQIMKPIEVALPTKFVNPAMQVFQGEVNGDSINWIDPDSLPPSPTLNSLIDGRILFQQNCATCHTLDRDATGPALRGFRGRGSWESNAELHRWVRNPAAFMQTNEYARKLGEQYGIVMQPFPDLSLDQVRSIALYIENEENNPYPDTLEESENTCVDSIPMPMDHTSLALPSLDPAMLGDTGVATDSAPLKQGAYVFAISSPGWFNIDIQAERLPGSVPCDVNVTSADSSLIVHLLIPKYRILVEGTFDNGKYAFDKPYGPMMLVPGTEAIVIAFGDGDEEGFYYGAQKLQIKSSVSLNLALQKGTVDELKMLLKENNLDKEQDSPLFNELEVIDNDLRQDSLKIVRFPCGASDSSTARIELREPIKQVY